jgi:hypothetical protein
MKVTIYKTLIRPVLVHGTEAWVLTKQDEMQLRCFERKILRNIYEPSHSRGQWRRRTNTELYRFYHADDILRVSHKQCWIRHENFIAQNIQNEGNTTFQNTSPYV